MTKVLQEDLPLSPSILAFKALEQRAHAEAWAIFVIVDEHQHEVAVSELGELLILLPTFHIRISSFPFARMCSRARPPAAVCVYDHQEPLLHTLSLVGVPCVFQVQEMQHLDEVRARWNWLVTWRCLVLALCMILDVLRTQCQS